MVVVVVVVVLMLTHTHWLLSRRLFGLPWRVDFVPSCMMV